MSILSEEELAGLKSSIAELVTTAAGATEQQAAVSLDQSYSIAYEKVRSGDWTEKRAAAYVETVQKAAAAVYATAQALRHRETKLAFVKIVSQIAGVVNARVGFELLPVT